MNSHTFSRAYPLLIAGLIAATGLTYSPNSQADLLTDIWNKLKATATDAADAAEDAGKTVTNTVDIQGKVLILQKAQQSFNGYTQQMFDMIENAGSEGRMVIQQEFEGLAAFGGASCSGGSDCYRFKNDLIAFVSDLESTGNLLFNMQDSSLLGNIYHFDPMINLIDAMPGYSLYPLYRAFTVDGGAFQSGFFDVFHEMTTHLETLRQGLSPNINTSLSINSLVGDSCQFINGNPAEFEQAAFFVTAGAGSIKLFGQLLKALGTTKIEPVAQVHGYVGGTIKNNPLKKFGELLNGISSAALTAANYGHNKLRYCQTQAIQQQIIANQQQVIDNQNQLLQRLDRMENSLPAGWTRKGNE
ncbi:hypothetical protein [Shewanella sp.]|uniref:hypothetical protein n=2 Tax=Shewanella sp. TaxID=50422 RepID=UPI003D0B109C